ncbi:MAG: hypothetical protein L0Y79_08195 [Chlorobi bacterium]|nr:hypothetical protein [Chlorobiota bacterium]MCI0715872.1 hypothetical protein [Chlorobiota bacterium]
MLSVTKAKLASFFIALIFVLALVSCTKKSDETGEVEDEKSTDMETVSADNFTESDEDLLTVDYKEFYDELAPHGEWVEVTDKDIGVDLKKGSASGESSGHRKISFAELFGIKDAHAYDDVSFGAFFVWRPSTNLAVSVVAGEPPVYVPYSNGQWVNTDAGWYFKAPTPHEEICHHHGRWVYSPALGWIWVPSRVWAPAWVEWREHDTYIAWTPIPPSVYIVNGVVVVPPIFPVYTERFVIVERRHFLEPGVYKYHYKEHKNKIMIKEWRKIDGVTVMNKTVINKGPDVGYFEKTKGGKIETVKINKVKSKDNVKYSSNEFGVYSPEFKKSKTKGIVDKTVSKPNNSVKFENASVKGDEKKVEDKGVDKKSETTGDKGSGKDKDKVSGKEDKGKEDKGRGNEKIKGEDKGKGKDKGADDKGKYKEDKSKGNKKSDNGNMKDGGKNKDSDNKPKGNDKGKGKK